MVLERGENFAGHEGLEGEDAPGFDARPFGMRARQDEEAVGPPARAEGAENLRLLAAHDVRRAMGIEDGKAGREKHAPELRRGEGQRRRGDFVDAGGAGGVGRLDPALPRADHAGHEDRQIGEPAAPPLHHRGEERLVLARREADGAPVRRDALERGPVGPGKKGAKGAGAPVDADEDRGL